MKKSAYLLIVISFIIVTTFFYVGCAHDSQKKESPYPAGQFYNKPYDAVWNALHELIFTDLGCAEKSVNKKKGEIETEWVTQITTEGTKRWKIEAEVKKKDTGAMVYIDKRIEMQDAAQKPVRRYNEQKKDDSPNAGWKHADDDPSSVQSLYQSLSNKLQ